MKKPNQSKKPLRLSTETVRQLEQRELATAAGGGETYASCGGSCRSCSDCTMQ